MERQLLSVPNAFQGLFLIFNKNQEVTDYAPENNTSDFLHAFSNDPRGKSPVELFPPGIDRQFSKGFKKLSNGNKSVEFDFFSSNNSKQTRHIRAVLSVIEEKDREGYLATLNEIPEKKASQDEYVKFEQYLLQTLMKNHPDSIYFKNTKSQFTRINHACAKKFNLNKHSEAIGKTDFDFFSFEHADNAYKDEQHIIKTGEPIVAKEEKEISLQNEISGDLWIEADDNMLKTILRNLVSNAIKFSSAGDSVKIKAAKRQEEIRISIIDEGKGIKKKDQNKILTKSVTYTTRGTNGEKGSGLGLDLCLDFVERHGGELQFESEPGKGSTFTLILPEKQETEAKVSTP